MAALELRPMSIGDILDITFRLYRTHFLRFLTITLLAYVPFGVMGSLFQWSMGVRQVNPFGVGNRAPGQIRVRVSAAGADSIPTVIAQQPGGIPFDPDSPFQPPSPAKALAGSLGFLLAALILLPLCQGALVHNISAGYLGEELSAGQSYARAAPRLGRLVLAQFLVGLAFMFGFCLLIVPAIIFMLWFSLIGPVVMLENTSVTGALTRSRELMRGNLGKAFRLGFVMIIISVVFHVALQSALRFVSFPHPILPLFVVNIVPALIVPVQLAPWILLYYDIRIRKEAFDLQRLAEALGVGAVDA